MLVWSLPTFVSLSGWHQAVGRLKSQQVVPSSAMKSLGVGTFRPINVHSSCVGLRRPSQPLTAASTAAPRRLGIGISLLV